MRDIAISVEGVDKAFKLPHEKQGSVKGVVINAFNSKKSFEQQQVLDNVSFEIKKGEFFGIVGRNGSGKSTLLKLLAEIYTPDTGTITVNGKLTPFIELGVGFNPELTGRENVFLNGALLGFNRKEMEAMYQDVVDFAELEKFMDQKLKNYSSGMQVRLAFSIAIRAESDILLLDEVLAVGDVIFQKKCFEYFKTLKKEKKTVVLVSHDSNILEEYCDSGILLEKGNIRSTGKIKKLVREYLDLMNETEETNENKKHNPAEKEQESGRWGTGKMIVTECLVKNHSGKNQVIFDDNEDNITIEVTYRSMISDPGPILGLTIEDTAGVKVFESNTKREKIHIGPLKQDEIIRLEWQVPNIFNTGTYFIAPAVANGDGTEMYDWRENYTSFKIRKRIPSNAVVNIAHKINVKD